MDNKKPPKPNILALISYISILCFIPFLFDSKNEFTIKHAKQGVVLFVFEMAIYVLLVIPVLGWLTGVTGAILAIMFSVIGITKVLLGQEWEIPYIGKYAKKINL